MEKGGRGRVLSSDTLQFDRRRELGLGDGAVPHRMPDVRCTLAATQDYKILRVASAWRILAREGEMRNRPARLLFHIMIAALLLCSLVACKKRRRSSGIKCGQNCASFQDTDSLPEQPPQGTIRLAIGGDSRDDRSGVVPWAL